MKKDPVVYERVEFGTGLVVKSNIKAFVELIGASRSSPFYNKVEVLPPDAKGECRVTIRYSPCILYVEFEKIRKPWKK